MYIDFIHYIVNKYKEEISPQETILEINGIIQDIRMHPNECVENLKDLRKQISEENGYCPLCSNEMNYTSWKESRGEYRGFQSEEEVGEMVCKECGYIY